MKKVIFVGGVFLFLLFCFTIVPTLIFIGIRKSQIFGMLFFLFAGILLNRKFHIFKSLSNKIQGMEQGIGHEEKKLIPNDRTIKILVYVIVITSILFMIYILS
ncbi:hypothetical protein A2714_02195 [Candidatus Woesebacteria bacterium RIFCSPHIGHO2_01_FULL_38_9]|uniref:DUF3899 domain-containing protein n=2 Tax=Candidatus Woeseibacteriota TaxID=1752722 RepID=A0A1F7Y540_9BACT|nr:MAG: hypothetical protein A2714_02195 [Candidatus Woesebacteria bacterium RIFCSPHIGHO2_01_FULL_38_9]OGM60373.1 MAG: hypothetical protein A3A75_03955 [Candidatus Woesebacteria bacterium RIFCSPLOWO2_01_FULL_39_10]